MDGYGPSSIELVRALLLISHTLFLFLFLILRCDLLLLLACLLFWIMGIRTRTEKCKGSALCGKVLFSVYAKDHEAVALALWQRDCLPISMLWAHWHGPPIIDIDLTINSKRTILL